MVSERADAVVVQGSLAVKTVTDMAIKYTDGINDARVC
jgi:hypothetical protein